MKNPSDEYYCTVCYWIGKESELVMIAGVLWDYTEHEACPACWEKYAIDSGVEKIKSLQEKIRVYIYGKPDRWRKKLWKAQLKQ